VNETQHAWKDVVVLVLSYTAHHDEIQVVETLPAMLVSVLGNDVHQLEP
jgi:hypothetical protein